MNRSDIKIARKQDLFLEGDSACKKCRRIINRLKAVNKQMHIVIQFSRHATEYYEIEINHSKNQNKRDDWRLTIGRK